MVRAEKNYDYQKLMKISDILGDQVSYFCENAENIMSYAEHSMSIVQI